MSIRSVSKEPFFEQLFITRQNGPAKGGTRAKDSRESPGCVIYLSISKGYSLQLALVAIVGDVLGVSPGPRVVVVLLVRGSVGQPRWWQWRWGNHHGPYSCWVLLVVLVAGHHVSVVVLAHFHKLPRGGLARLVGYSQCKLSTLDRKNTSWRSESPRSQIHENVNQAHTPETVREDHLGSPHLPTATGAQGFRSAPTTNRGIEGNLSSSPAT